MDVKLGEEPKKEHDQWGDYYMCIICKARFNDLQALDEHFRDSQRCRPSTWNEKIGSMK